MGDFFEALRKRALHDASPSSPEKKWKWVSDGIDASIEALKKMMVGKPIEAILEHEISQDTESSYAEEWTTIDSHPLYLERYAECGFRGHHGIDGEEVTVMVFGDGEKREK